MISMTGYGFIEEINGNLQTSAEIKSFNNRYLDIYVDIPKHLAAYEKDIKQIINQQVSRGKILVAINVKEKDPEIDICVDLHLAKKFYDAYKDIFNEFKLDGSVQLNHFLRQDGILTIENNSDSDAIWDNVKNVVSKSLQHFINGKSEEGRATQENILELINKLCQDLESVKSLTPLSLGEYHKRLNNRFAELVGDHQFDEQRIITEIGILLSKSDINEEIERLQSHINQFLNTCKNEAVVGKKLDFITQEMLREINTIGAKANNIDISNLVINMKNNLEKIKEQIRNVE